MQAKIPTVEFGTVLTRNWGTATNCCIISATNPCVGYRHTISIHYVKLSTVSNRPLVKSHYNITTAIKCRSNLINKGLFHVAGNSFVEFLLKKNL